MAASSVMQVVPASSITRSAARSSAIRPCLRRTASFRLRCAAEEDKRDQAAPTPVPPPALKPEPLSAPPSPAPKAGTKFADILAFSGPGPERINGRLAMTGFVAAIAVEAWKGQDLLDQIGNGGIPLFLGASVVLSVASLIPLLRGVSAESKSKGLMTSDAELWNGRFAMLGLVALAFTEYVTGGTLV